MPLTFKVQIAVVSSFDEVAVNIDGGAGKKNGELCKQPSQRR